MRNIVTDSPKVLIIFINQTEPVAISEHRLSEKERKLKKRSPKKIQPEESEDDKTEEEEDMELGTEINLRDTDITPEAQKILDTFANQLLEKIEEKVAENVVQIEPQHSLQNKKLFGKHEDKGKKSKDDNCICCKVREKLIWLK